MARTDRIDPARPTLTRPSIPHQLGIAARLAWRAVMRRLRGESAPPADDARFRSDLGPWVARLPRDRLAGHAFHYLPATEPPWHDTGMDLETGDPVTLLADGRVFASRLLDLWVAPSFQLWCRIGESGPIFRGTRDTHSFVADKSGRLWLAGMFPGEWADETGRLATPPGEFAKVSGGTSVLVLRWRPGVRPAELLPDMAMDPHCPDLVAAEATRLEEPAVPLPDGWRYLWFLGPAEIYRNAPTSDGRAGICCQTWGEVGILQRATPMPLSPGTLLRWTWRVDELPIDLAEDTALSHDYLSIAVEFDDGQDITYYWSSSLPVGTAYRCPLPTWTGRETHVVVRSGQGALGRWLDEERDLHADYTQLIGGPAREIVRVWLIAMSLHTRGRGRCEYSRIELASADRKTEVL